MLAGEVPVLQRENPMSGISPRIPSIVIRIRMPSSLPISIADPVRSSPDHDPPRYIR